MSAEPPGASGSHAQGVAVARALVRRPILVLGGLVVITLGLAWPMVFWTSDATASQSPVTEVTVTQELVAKRFADEVFRALLLVEAVDGDVLDKAPLLALLENSAAMRTDAEIGDLLVELRDPDLGIDIDGVWTIADAVDRLLRRVGVAGGLAGASEQQIDGAVAGLLEASDPLDWGLVSQTSRDDAGLWHSPALFVTVAADNERLGGGGFLVTIGTDALEKEEFARTVQAAMRGDGAELTVWAPAGDVNLTSNEQGELAGPFIGMTIAAVLLIIGVAFRSYWVVAVSGAALAVLMVWLRGGANLIGLEKDQLLSTILPISMISFGIDSAFHGIGRVREEGRRGIGPQQAFVVGLGSVFGALALAATSDAAAFFANTAAGIESVVQFGLAAGLATVAAFVLLGVATPLTVTIAEERAGSGPVSRFGVVGDLVLALVAAGAATATVLVLVFVSERLGLLLLGIYLVVCLVVPLLLSGQRRKVVSDRARLGRRSAARLGRVVAAVAERPWVAVAAAAVVTAAALWSAMQLKATFDVKDFFSPESDFVVALDKTADYLGGQGGEPAVVYVEGRLAAPESIAAVDTFVTTIGATDSIALARDSFGEVKVNRGVLELLEDIEEGTGAAESDVAAMFDEALRSGISTVDGAVGWSENDVGTVLWGDSASGRYATVLRYEIPDTRDQTNVIAARGILEPAAAVLEESLRASDPDANVVVTGSAVYRDDQLAGVRRALLLALPIAVFACFAVAAVFMRSARYALVSIVPILLVVAWLYGLMRQAGYAINVVTAIIGAVSIGIGIDFSTHFTMRFLEEMRGGHGRSQAVAAAGAGTGTALVGSALTSVAGFGILAFAPMPMFATYGRLTALMIVLALAAALFVLPSLLVIVTGDAAPARPSATGRVVDLRLGQTAATRVGLARDLSDEVVDRVLAALEPQLRRGELTVRTVPGDAVPGLVADGTVDLGLVVRWPGMPAPSDPRFEVLPVASEELVAVEGARRIPGEQAALDDLAHALIVAGPHPESEEGVRQLLALEAQSPVLAHTVADVLTGARLARITGGAMILPRSMAGRFPVRSLDPPAHVETLLLTTPARSADPTIFDIVVAITDALETRVQ